MFMPNFEHMFNRKIPFSIGALFFVGVIFLYFHNLCLKGADPDIIDFDYDWKISYADTVVYPNEIGDFKIPSTINVGDTIVYEKKIEKGVPPLSLVRFRTYYSSIHVSLDDTELYRYGDDIAEQRLMVGSGYHYIGFPENIEGKILKITLVVMERSAKKTFSSMKILPNRYFSDYYSHYGLSVAIGLFLSMFGAISVFVGILALGFSRMFYRLMLIGFMSLLLGVWTLCYMKVIQIFSMDFSFNTKLEYFSLYLTIVPFDLLLLNMRRGKIKKWKWNFLCGLAIFSLLFFICTTFMQSLNILHYPATLPIFHITVLVTFSFLFIFRILYDFHVGMEEKVMTLGMSIFGLFAFLDVFRYNFQKYFSINSTWLEVTWLPIGILFFIILLIVSYFIYLYTVVMDKSEREFLRQMAFKDSLTGLYNRAKCKRIFEVLNSSDSDYAIVSIDLNDLKKTNDTYGHTRGDDLIISFSKVFKNAFDGVGTTIRMGGDEFVAIVRSEHLDDLPDVLKKMEYLEEHVTDSLPVPLDAAYGCAIHKKGDSRRAQDVYNLADIQMYQMKAESKKNRK